MLNAALLETKRLILRRFTEADVDHLYALDNDPEVMRFINGGIPTSREIIQNNILPNFLHFDAQSPGFGFWALDEKASGEFLGWLSFRPTGSMYGEVALGFRLRKTAWGKGYATEGAQALIHKGFAELGVQRVVATTYEKNIASQHVLEKLGLKLVRKFRYTEDDLKNADTFHVDATELWVGFDLAYALEKADWEQQYSG